MFSFLFRALKGPERISRIQQNNGSIYHPFFRDILLLRGKNFHSSFFFSSSPLEMNKNARSSETYIRYLFFLLISRLFIDETL